MPPRKKKKKAERRDPLLRSVGNIRVKGAYLIDCITCGGGKKRCRLCRNMDGKVWVKE